MQKETIPGINYEVALDLLDEAIHRQVNARAAERAKDKPCQAFIDYCSAQIDAIYTLRDELSPEDEDIIERIFDPNDLTVGRVK